MKNSLIKYVSVGTAIVLVWTLGVHLIGKNNPTVEAQSELSFFTVNGGKLNTLQLTPLKKDPIGGHLGVNGSVYSDFSYFTDSVVADKFNVNSSTDSNALNVGGDIQIDSLSGTNGVVRLCSNASGKLIRGTGSDSCTGGGSVTLPQCGTTANTCVSGASSELADTSSESKWECTGISTSGGTLTASCSAAITETPTSCYSCGDGWVTGTHTGDYYKAHPKTTLCNSVPNSIQFTWDAYDRPNKFTFGNANPTSTGWKGYATTNGPWGNSLSTSSHGTENITFTSSSNRTIQVESGNQPTPTGTLTDGWGWSISCSTTATTTPQSCTLSTYDGYSFAGTIASGANQTKSKSKAISGGTQTLTRTASCTNGSVSYSPEAITDTSCNSGYSKSGNNCIQDTSGYSGSGTSYTGTWQTGSWGSCSTSCGSGSRTRSVSCSDGNCDPNTKPDTNQTCSSYVYCPTNGSCGSSNNACSAGNLNNTADSSTQYLWQCTGINGGSTSSCSLNKPINGVCGSSSFTCNSGSVGSGYGSSGGSGTWSCSGQNGGSTVQCGQSAPPAPTYSGVWRTTSAPSCSTACGQSATTKYGTVTCSTGNSSNCNPNTKPSTPSRYCSATASCSSGGGYGSSGGGDRFFEEPI